MKKELVLSAALLMGLTFIGTSTAAEEAAATKPGIVIGSIINKTATVAAINAETREVTLKNEDTGATQIIECGPQVRNFNQIKVGDLVSVTYGQSVALFVKEGTSDLQHTQALEIESAPVGANPSATAVAVTELQAAVEDINYETRLISLEGAAGKKFSFIAGDEVERFNEIKKGDHVVARLTEAVAIDVTTPKVQ